MNATTKLFSKLKSAGSIGAVIGIVALAILILSAIGMIGGLLLIWGLNLMGLSIAYSFKTVIGAAIVILSVRPTSFSSNKEK